MKAQVIGSAVLVLFAGAGLAQQRDPLAGFGGSHTVPSLYDPAKGPLPPDRRYVMTREGRDAAAWEAQNPQPVVQPAQSQPVRVTAPTWFGRLPEDTETEMYAAATASSMDEQMAYDKARMQAERKLVESMSAKIRTLTKSYRNDQGTAMIEKFEQTVQKTADGTLVGVRRIDSQTQFDGRVYKVYVLLRYPLGENNIVRREQESQRLHQQGELRAARAHQELEKKTQQEQEQKQREAETQRRELGPVPEATKPVESVSQSKVAPVTVPTAQGDLQLMDVDNEEYKRRRDQALQKPGAVIGQSVVR